ncbi:unnamed protein product [Meganyctiphanes norvegica]|uniref:Calpain catalytic domain-containing protein n=1 Tax=Meganyctiphanes norvegica TaxID=48144 RepID=A0AAV2QD98_MEGNR
MSTQTRKMSRKMSKMLVRKMSMMKPPGEDRRNYHNQDFHEIRAQCIREDTLFEDPEFPADDSSLGDMDKQIEWKRPMELVQPGEKPKFLVNGNRFSVVQGEIGDCWFLSAMSAITLNPGLLKRVLPDNLNFEKDYAGIFYFSIWQGGHWVNVVVDDRLPVMYGNQLAFSSSRDTTEFWSALLEKAYAKLHGSYSALNSGKCFEATEDLTGGVTERFFLDKDIPEDFFTYLLKSRQRGSLITCGIPGSGEVTGNNGLVAGHAYCVTAVRRVSIMGWKEKSKVHLIRIRNPWGDETEWNGAWSDGSKEWGLLNNDEKEKHQITIDNDGEFWMNFEDFNSNFKEVYITSLNPNTVNREALAGMDNLADLVSYMLHMHPSLNNPKPTRKVWDVQSFEGAWIKGSSAGGSINNPKMFSCNSQYVLTLKETDDGSDKCSVMISLMQKNRRNFGLKMHGIGLYIFEMDDTVKDAILPASWFRFNRPTDSTSPFRPARSVSQRFQLPPGRYCIIPCTFKEDQEAEFLLRVFCEKKTVMEENDEELMAIEEPDEADGMDLPQEQSSTEKLQEIFKSVATESQCIDTDQLAQVLDQLHPGVEFGGDLCRSLLAMLDGNYSGDIDIYELMTLEGYLDTWIDTYNSKKDPETGLLSGRSWGLGDALKSMGMQLPRRLQTLLVVRYGNADGHFTVRNFIWATAKTITMMERFTQNANPDGQTATIRIGKWLEDSIYC